MRRVLFVVILLSVIFVADDEGGVICRRTKSPNSYLIEITAIFDVLNSSNQLASLTKLRSLMNELAEEDKSIKKEVVMSLTSLAISSKEVYKRKTALYCLSQLFPYLDTETRLEIVVYFYKKYIAAGVFTGLIGQFVTPQNLSTNRVDEGIDILSFFVTSLNEKEMGTVNPEIIDLVGLRCAGAMLLTQIDQLSKLIRFLTPTAQLTSVNLLFDGLNQKDNLDYRGEILFGASNCLAVNMKYFNQDILSIIYQHTINILMNTSQAKQSIRIELGTALAIYIEDADKKKQLKMLLSIFSD
ncbi:MAG: hypothetical protein P9X27_05215 [Candidatus Kaelpia aquatica]|nr:hypothetical protein [Candidatus Kaelpia aquatica]